MGKRVAMICVLAVLGVAACSGGGEPSAQVVSTESQGFAATTRATEIEPTTTAAPRPTSTTTTTAPPTTTTSTTTTTTTTAPPTTTTTAPPPPPPPPPTSPPTTAPPQTQGAYYANCSEAEAAGAAPLRVGDPGYGPHLDRDNDGIACE